MNTITILIIVLALSLLIYWLIYLSKTNPNKATYTRGTSNKTYNTTQLLNGQFDNNLLRLNEYAELSDIVYRRDGKEKVQSFLNWKLIPTPMIDAQPKDRKKKKLPGFYYEIWELDEATDVKVVAVAFRGTLKSMDWVANLRWVRRLFYRKTWDHYDQLKAINASMIDSIHDRFASSHKEIQIVSTGHSLGGGLAQYLAYLNPEVKHVFAFDPSPVTGFYDVKPRSKRNENKKGIMIYRVFESGEGLSFIRKMLTFIYPAPLLLTKDPALIRIRFSFKTAKNALNQHSIRDLANSLLEYKNKTL